MIQVLGSIGTWIGICSAVTVVAIPTVLAAWALWRLIRRALPTPAEQDLAQCQSIWTDPPTWPDDTTQQRKEQP